MAELKPEIKVEGTAADLKDIEEFEDDVDLTFPDPNAQSWLTRVPEDLWKAWYDIYKDAPEDSLIEVGKMRVYHQPQGQDNPLTQKLQLRLHQHVPEHQGIPKKYDLKITSADYNNTVVFSEKDLPGHKTPQIGSNRSRLQPNKPTGIPSRDQRYGKGGRGKSSIPKQTALAARVQHEATAAPIIDAQYEADFQRKWAAHMAPKSRTNFVSGVERVVDTASANYLNTFNTFGMSAKPKSKLNKAERTKDKAVRMERGDLLNALQDCFRRHRYWGMKTLRRELKQPEAWIREVLEEIAYLVRSGDFALTWTLKPEWQSIIQADNEIKEEVAVMKEEPESSGVTGDELGAGDDDDDDLDGFEDVKMDGGV